MMANGAPGSSLYRLVAEYGGFEHHRTGTEHERRTQAWLGDHLTDRGAVVRTATYDFDQFVVAEHHVTLDGRPSRQCRCGTPVRGTTTPATSIASCGPSPAERQP
ncbi:MAG: hypothetical protein R2710_07895 [Acidimicrobiales bacterium]